MFSEKSRTLVFSLVLGFTASAFAEDFDLLLAIKVASLDDVDGQIATLLDPVG